MPKMLNNAMSLLIKNEIRSKDQILDELLLQPSDIESLTNLPTGFFNNESQIFNLKLKEQGNVNELPRSKLRGIEQPQLRCLM